MSNQDFFVVRAIDDKKVNLGTICVGDFSAGREVITTNNLNCAMSCLAGSKRPQAVFLVPQGRPAGVEIFQDSNLPRLCRVKITKTTTKKAPPRQRRQRNSTAPLKP